MSLYAQYILERENKKIIEDSQGFCTYFYVNEETVYIEDIFVVKSARRSGKCFKLADQVVKEAKEAGRSKLLGSIDVTANGSTDSMKVLLAYGMSVHSTNGNLIYFIKDI